jgi:hypothetical protein
MIDINTAIQSLYRAANANVAYKTSSWTSEKQFKPNPIYKHREFRKDPEYPQYKFKPSELTKVNTK